MVVSLNLHPFVVVDPICNLDKGVVGSNIGCIVDLLGYGVGCLGHLSGYLEDLVVVQLLLYNF